MPTPKSAIIFQIFAENCMKMNEFGPQGGETLASDPGSANASRQVKFEVTRVDRQVGVHRPNANWLRSSFDLGGGDYFSK